MFVVIASKCKWHYALYIIYSLQRGWRDAGINKQGPECIYSTALGMSSMCRYKLHELYSYMVRRVLYLLNVCLHQGALLCAFFLKLTSLVLRLHHCMSSATDHQLCLLDLAFGVCSFSLALFIPFVVYHSFG